MLFEKLGKSILLPKSVFGWAAAGVRSSTMAYRGLLPVIWDPILIADWSFGEYFESDSVSIHQGVFPLRTRARQAESTLELRRAVC